VRGHELVKTLGFEIHPHPGPISVLVSKDTKVAVAVFLERSEPIDIASGRFSDQSPISYALAAADRENLDYVLISSGPVLRLYPTRTGVGVGRRGRTETFIEAHLDLIPSDKAAYLWLLFSAEALAPTDGSFQDILNRSADYAADLGKRLRERIYRDVIPKNGLAKAVVDARSLRKPTADDLAQTYQMALTILFRLLFIAYAEDKELLPYRTNGLYCARSLKQKARDILQIAQAGTGFDTGTSHWDDIVHLFRAVECGNREWGVPLYNGGLFSSDPDESPIGAAIAQISLTNDVFGPILRDLLVDQTGEGWGPIDFRSLGVREFGTVYEGLLESELSVAEGDLAVDANDAYIPAKDPKKAVVRIGEIYLHNASGARKSSGSYFTKSFAVEHLLDHALEPALDDHIARLNSADDRRAAEAFFDFRVADIAMGSGHFLVAAVDRIERRLSGYLAERPLRDVTAELIRLRAAAFDALGSLCEGIDIEDTQLLRRQIARRCIYGVDIKPLSVELARLSIWIHTFVPGLPLSFLDHNLVLGNSLVGIATIDEARELIGAEAGDLFADLGERLIGAARDAAERLARLSDANAAEIREARKAWKEAKKAIAPTAALFDVLAASRLDPEIRDKVAIEATHWVERPGSLVGSAIHGRATELMREVPPFHFPIAFPEVFLRKRSGFDVILGNPPWEKVKTEEHEFWGRHTPGFRSLPQHERETALPKMKKARPDLVRGCEIETAQAAFLRRVLTSEAYPGMGTGDPDLYKAFAWRFWHLVHGCGGRIGVVLPRSAFCGKGSEAFRKHVLAHGGVEDLTMILNNRLWFFETHPQYTVALATISKAKPGTKAMLALRGPFAGLRQFEEGTKKAPARFAVSDVLSWTDTAAFPLLPTEESLEVFVQLRKSLRLDLDDGTSWRVRPHRELDASNDKHVMDFSRERPKAFWPVFKGESFDIWENDTGRYYAWADPEVVTQHLQAKRERGHRNSKSVFSEFPVEWIRKKSILPCYHARIAFRDVSRSTDSRTVRAALVPPKVVITHKGPYLLWPRGDEEDQAYFLGTLSSIPLDWFTRRFVETHLTFHVLNGFPIPRPSRDNLLYQRAVQLAGRLACPDERFAEWAEAVSVEYGPLHPDQKADMVAELDAVVAHLYGLSEQHLRHIFETFHEGWNYEDRLRATLKHYEKHRL
jgi:hypothetical protein